uniref:p53 DNA-binding domain-containing protein n=1 Tax=Anopheles epiroticus TaxID=199890 RepID=A0A182PA25_9DIPT
MDLLNPEMFGDLNTGSYQSAEDCQTLYRMNTNELLPAQGCALEDYVFSELLENAGVAKMEFIKYETDTKPLVMEAAAGGLSPTHHQKIPALDDFTNPQQVFTVGVSGKPCSASSWCYSNELKKLFVKKKTPVTFDVTYTQPSDCNLKLRIMLVYSNTQYAYNVITRCQDDISKDNAKDYAHKDHVVRCLNPGASFTGRENGLNFEDRLAVLVELNHTGTQNQLMQQTVPVSLEFLCQNSCPTMERRATTLLFTVENEHGTLLGRKSVSVKICSCPKRDMEKDEKKTSGGGRENNKNKRKHANDVVSSSDQPPRKVTRQASLDMKSATSNSSNHSAAVARESAVAVPAAASTMGQIKREPSFTPLGYSLSNLSNSSSSNAIDNDSSAVVLTLRLPDFKCASEVAMYAYKHLSSILIGCKDDKEKNRYAQYLLHCRRVGSKYSSSHH